MMDALPELSNNETIMVKIVFLKVNYNGKIIWKLIGHSDAWY